jgi:putative RecB family exonuclease
MFKYAPYSHSKIETWKACPRQFRYRYIDRLPVEKKPQIYFDRGKLFHLLLEYNGDLKTIKKTKEFQEIKEHKLLDSNQIKEIYKIYKTFISQKPGKDIVSKKVFLKEFPLGLNKDLELVSYNADEVLLRGYIDACYLIPERDDVCLVVDWKSGKYKSKEDQSYAQLLWYSLGLFSKNPYLEKILLVFAYVEHNKINTKTVQRKDINRYKQALYNTIDKIEQDQNFNKIENGHCNYCDYLEVCRGD